MTLQDFETWINGHYEDLLAVAKTLTDRDPEDVVQTAILGMWQNPDLDLRVRLHVTDDERERGLISVWNWAKGHVRGAAGHAKRSQRRNGTKHLPGHLRGEEGAKGVDTKTEKRRTVKLSPEQDALRYADNYYLNRLEEDRRDFDMDGHGRTKKDKPFEVRLPGGCDEQA